MKLNTELAWRPESIRPGDYRDLRVAIVGGTGGIGRAFAQSLASNGAHVIVAGQTFRDAGLPNIEFVKGDVSLLREAKRVAGLLAAESLDAIVFTTGIMAGPKREVTTEGVERDLAISYLSRFVILRDVASRLGTARKASKAKPRLFIVGFPGTNQLADVADLNSERSYGRWKAHMATVAGNEALVLDSARRYPNINVFGLNPGFVKSNIRSNLFGSKIWLRLMEAATGFMTSTAEDYAARAIPLLVAPEIETKSGAMFNKEGKAIKPSPKILVGDYVERLMAASDQLVNHISSTTR